MSVENALAFLKLAERERALREQIGRLKGRAAIDGLVTLGAGYGLSFTAGEYREAVVAMANGELDDAALAAVLEEVGLGKGKLESKE
jgi:hypothetical protein